MPLSPNLQRRLSLLLMEAHREMVTNDLRATSVFLFDDALERPRTCPPEVPGVPVAMCHLVVGTELVIDLYNLQSQLYAERAKGPMGGKAGPSNGWILDPKTGRLTQLTTVRDRGDN